MLTIRYRRVLERVLWLLALLVFIFCTILIISVAFEFESQFDCLPCFWPNIAYLMGRNPLIFAGLNTVIIGCVFTSYESLLSSQKDRAPVETDPSVCVVQVTAQVSGAFFDPVASDPGRGFKKIGDLKGQALNSKGS